MMSTTRHLAARIAEKFRYVEGVVDEARDLAGACDVVLTRSDGRTFAVFCLVDAEVDEAKRFGLGRAAVKEILARCRDRHCGTITGAKEPATLEIVEVRRSVVPEDLARLRDYGNHLFDVDAVHAFAVDCSRATATTATRWSFWSGRRRFLEREVRTLALP